MSPRRFPFQDPEEFLRRGQAAQRAVQEQLDAAARDPRQLDMFAPPPARPVRIKSAHMRDDHGRGHR